MVKKEFIKVPDGHLILGNGLYYSKDGMKTHVNNNVLVVGRTGGGKTRNLVKPNLLQLDGSYVISDPKGSLCKEFGPFLREKGYNVLEMDFIHPERSLHYNPFFKARNTTDIKKIAHAIVYDKGTVGGHYDPFWDETANMLLKTVIGYLYECKTYGLQTVDRFDLSSLKNLIVQASEPSISGRREYKLGDKMSYHVQQMNNIGQYSWAYDQYKQFKTVPEKTHDTITICTLAKLDSMDSIEIRQMLSADDLDFKRIGLEKTVLFVKVSDSDRSMDTLVNIFYTQLMNELCTFADDECPNSRLPIPVQFILDDFATNCRIDNFQNMISNIRSRNISTMLICQSEAQLESGYGVDARTIVDNCASYVYLGGSNVETAQAIAKRCNKPLHDILNMPIDYSWVFRLGEPPHKVPLFNIDAFQIVKGFEPYMPPVEPFPLAEVS